METTRQDRGRDVVVDPPATMPLTSALPARHAQGASPASRP